MRLTFALTGLFMAISMPAQSVFTLEVDESGEGKIGKTTFTLLQKPSYDYIEGQDFTSNDSEPLGVEGKLIIRFQETFLQPHIFMEEIQLDPYMNIRQIARHLSDLSNFMTVFVDSKPLAPYQQKKYFLTFLSKLPGRQLTLDSSYIEGNNIENIFPRVSGTPMESLCCRYMRSDCPNEIFYESREVFLVDDSIIVDFTRSRPAAVVSKALQTLNKYYKEKEKETSN